MSHKGFTLIEVLIALVIFAILASLTSSALYQAFNTRNRVAIQSQRLVSLQLAIVLMQRDITQAISRSILGNEMHVFPSFLGGASHLEFTRTGVLNPSDAEKRSTLQRVAYFCRNNQLIRRSWPTLDTANREAFEEKILLQSLNECKFSYINRALQVLEEWHEKAAAQDQETEALPKAVKIDLKLDSWGKIDLLFPIPKALYAE